MNSIKDLSQELQKLQQSVADMGCDKDVNVSSLVQYLDARINYLRSDIERLYERIWEHEKGHIPALTSPSQMAKALKALGLDGDYDVQKRVIYASDGKQQEVQFKFLPAK